MTDRPTAESTQVRAGLDTRVEPTPPTSATPPAQSQPVSLGERVQQALSGLGGDKRTQPAQPRPAAAARPTRRARLRLTRVDPWSVMKTAFLLSIAFGIVTVVSTALVWSVLGAAGVWDSINSSVGSVVSSDGSSTFDIRDYASTSRIVGFTVLVAAVDVLLLTAMATLGAFLYNLAAALVGGLEVTLAEDDH